MRLINDGISEIIPYPAHVKTVTSTGIIYKGPCLVSAITITGAGGDANCQVYDGLNTEGELKFNLYALSGTTFNEILMHPTDFDYGIYVNVGTATTVVTVQFIPEDYHRFL